MSPSVSVALAAIRKSVDMLEESVADTEPAPVTIVLLQASDGGKVHRAARIEGIPGLMTYEADNLDWTDYKVIPDLSRVNDDMALCRRCFGTLDADMDVDTDEAPEVSIIRAYSRFSGKRANGTTVTGIIPQFDGSDFAGSNCGAASEAMRDVSQQKGIRPGKGSPWQPTGKRIRDATGDTKGGLNPSQTTAATRAVYGIPTAAPRIWEAFDAIAKLKGGYAVDLLVGYGPINKYRSGSPGFTGNHRGVATAIDTDRRMWEWADPLYDGRRSGIPLGKQWIPQSVMYAAAGALVLDPATGRTVVDGDAYFIPSLTRIDTGKYRAVVPKGTYGAYFVSGGVIKHRTIYSTGGFSADCTAPQTYPVAPGANVPGGTFRLVLLTSGSHKGRYINAKFAHAV